jgi:hypothetical protein
MQVKGPHVSATIATDNDDVRNILSKLGNAPTDSNGTAYSTLTLLNAKVGQKYRKDVLRSERLGNIAESVDCCSSNSLLVGLKQV